MKFLKQLAKARWFPTVTKPIISGLVASGVVYGLHALGITSFTTWEVNSLVTPLVGFLVAAIVQQASKPASLGTVQVQATAAIHTADYKPEPTLGKTIAQTLLNDIAHEIDSNPALVRDVATQALQNVLNPVQAVEAADVGTELLKTILTPGQDAASPAFQGRTEPTT